MVSALELDIVMPDKNSGQLASQLHRQLRAAIASGRLTPGVQLPPTRKLASQLGVSRNTVIAAYDLLLSEGYVSGKAGSGIYVNKMEAHRFDKPRTTAAKPASLISPYWRRPPAPIKRPMPEKIRYDFRFGLPDMKQFPHHIWQRLAARSMRRTMRGGDAAGPPEGLDVLREAITRHVSFSRAVACKADNVIVTNGSQQGFTLLAQILVRRDKTVVAVEDPGYRPARYAFAAAGAVIKPVPVDAEGMVIAKVPKEANIIYVTPTHQSPLGVTMSAARRAQLLTFAMLRNAVIIEDDYDSEFRFGDRPQDALQTLDQAGLVFYVGTFTKCLLPSLRVGFVVAPPWATDALIAAKRVADVQSATILHATLADFINEGHLARYVRKMRNVYSARNDLVHHMLTLRLPHLLEPIRSSAGIHCSAYFRKRVGIADVMARVAKAGIAIEDLDRFWLASPKRSGLAFGYSAMNEGQISEGLKALAVAFR